jgi:urease accessory protein
MRMGDRGMPSHEGKIVGPLTEERVRRQLRIIASIAAGAFTLAGVLASGAAVAHTGAEHATSFTAGVVHPFSGLDHMLAMVAVGLWAGLVGGRAFWVWPAVFVGMMVLGGLVGMSGASMPLVEPGILASVVVLGLLVLSGLRLPVAAGAVLVGLFALLHGYAHGVEVAPGATVAAASYAAGFALATAALHGLGLVLARLGHGDLGRWAVRGAGALVVAGGVALAIA